MFLTSKNAAIRRASSLVSTWLLIFAEPILWFSAHSRTGRGISLVLPWFEADNHCGSRGTVRVPMLVRILRSASRNFDGRGSHAFRGCRRRILVGRLT